MKIYGTPDKWSRGGKDYLNVLSQSWLNSASSTIKEESNIKNKRITIDLSDINFVSAFEWIILTSLIDRIVSEYDTIHINIDLVGNSTHSVISPSNYLKLLKQTSLFAETHTADMRFSHRVYQIAGFLEAFGTKEALLNDRNNISYSYPWLNISEANFHEFYGYKKTRPTVFLGLTKIIDEENCNIFLEDEMVFNWRNAMREKFPNSPILETEEIWRSICHEIATNIWEHSNSSGFIFYRVVDPLDSKNNIRWWCKHSYDEMLEGTWVNYSKGFLEICSSDSGDGFVKKLKKVYEDQFKNLINNIDEIKVEDVLSFAFDEFGTCKTNDESWVLTRHALGRILLIISKYGGVLKLRSDGKEICYISLGKGFKRKINGMGYEPSFVKDIDDKILGSHIQILIPLFPEVKYEDAYEIESIYNYLPTTYTIDPDHVRGHLVPVLESIGYSHPVRSSEDIKKFRNACTRLNNDLREKHPINEPLIFDFNSIKWEPPQFETFLFLMQNIIQKRLVLLVEIDTRLANEVTKLEEQISKTFINKEVLGATSEKLFLETYTGINHIVLGISQDGNAYLFGLSNIKYRAAILSLVSSPDTIKGISTYIDASQENEAYLKTVLTNENKLFYIDKNNYWHFSWDSQEIYQQTNRAITRHFEHIAQVTGAWQGPPPGSDGQFEYTEKDNVSSSPQIIKKFNLPWQEEWRESFLESSKILSRERYSDEAAQRLIYRLNLGLIKIDKSLEDVNVLVCVTAPALMLATAIHRWWPNVNRPIVADLSYNVLLESSLNLPSIIDEGGIVIVQDIFERGKVSGELLDKLKKQSKDILCAISLLKFNDTTSHIRVTAVNEGWDLKEHEILGVLPNHSLIEIPSPKKCSPPNDDDNDSDLFWVEPRSLHPTSYKHLRRDFSAGRDPFLKRRDSILPEFENLNSGCLFASGHYVYGHRHYQVAIDIKRLLKGEIGQSLIKWVVDVCEGNPKREKADWEQKTDFDFIGDVTFVLMPLHSQIHYLWPNVKNMAAQRGRRQLMSLLDATLFTGRRPTYRISHHLEQQLERSSMDAIGAYKRKEGAHPSPLRLLILDDSIASARTAETILLSITNRLKIIFNKVNEDIENIPREYHPIQWIRYFAVLNQMGHANYTLWHGIKNIGTPPIPFVLDEYAPFMGVPVFEENDCPYCNDRARLKQLISNCNQFGVTIAASWAKDLYDELKPIATDGPTFRSKHPTPIVSGIDILGLKSKKMQSHPIKYISKYSDTAIWRFFKLMHLSYPIEDILKNIDKWWKYKIAEKKAYSEPEYIEYQRYRWAVIEWCIKNWPRVKASTARDSFVNVVEHEFIHNTDLVEKILNASSRIYTDKYILSFIKKVIKDFEKLELQRKDDDKVIDKDRISRVERLDIGLSSFFFNIPEIQYDNLHGYLSEGYDGSPVSELLDALGNATKELQKIGTNLINNLYTRLTRPKSIASPKWALNAVAENLFRGRDPENAPAGRHNLLPRVIHDNFSKKKNIEDILLLEGGLSVFSAALNDLLPYAYISSSDSNQSNITSGAENVRDLLFKLIEWIKKNPRDKLLTERPSELRQLYDALSLDGEFVQGFNNIFQVNISFIEKHLKKIISDKGFVNDLDFQFNADKEILDSTILCYINSVLNILANHTIDPMANKQEKYKSKIIVYQDAKEESLTKLMVFRLLTNFDSLQTTNKKIFETKRGLRELINIEIFGAIIKRKEWFSPDQQELQEGYTACWEILFPTGYISKGE